MNVTVWLILLPPVIRSSLDVSNRSRNGGGGEVLTDEVPERDGSSRSPFPFGHPALQPPVSAATTSAGGQIGQSDDRQLGTL